MCDKYNRKIQQYKDINLIIIFYSEGCYYCDSAMELLKTQNIPFKGYKIDKINGGLSELISCLLYHKEMTHFNENHTTKPIIFFRGNFIGGYTDLVTFLEYKSKTTFD